VTIERHTFLTKSIFIALFSRWWWWWRRSLLSAPFKLLKCIEDNSLPFYLYIVIITILVPLSDYCRRHWIITHSSNRTQKKGQCFKYISNWNSWMLFGVYMESNLNNISSMWEDQFHSTHSSKVNFDRSQAFSINQLRLLSNIIDKD
jgi:hypothetical protein